MAGRQLRTFAIAGICAGFVLAGAAAEVVLLPRAVPKPPAPGKSDPLTVMTQAQMEGLLAKVAKGLNSDLRAKLANQGFLAKAPAEVVGELRDSEKATEQQLAVLRENLATLR